MIVKVFSAVRFLSMVAVFANLLYVYASLPEQVVVLEEGIESISIGRDSLFYSAMMLIALVNVVAYLFSKKIAPSEEFRTWIHGLVITLNIFFIISMSFIGVYNSSEKYDFSSIGFIIYGSVGLVALWAVSLPVYIIGKKILAK
jgi:nitrate reductase NapE component